MPRLPLKVKSIHQDCPAILLTTELTLQPKQPNKAGAEK